MGCVLNRADVAECFGVALTTVDAWVNAGCPTKSEGSRGKSYEFDSEEVFRWFLTREKRKRRVEDDATPPVAIDRDTGELRVSHTEADRLKAVADALKSELDLEARLKLVAPVETIRRIVSDEIAIARARLLAIPTKFRPSAQMHASTPERAKKLVAAIDDLIRDALTEIKSYGAG